MTLVVNLITTVPSGKFI